MRKSLEIIMTVKILKEKKLALINKKAKKIIRKKKEVLEVKKNGFCIHKGDSKYKQGKFYSKKNNTEVIFRSTYELGYFHILEQDDNVIAYIVEPFEIAYIFDGRKRKYWPDIMVLYRDGSVKIIEIKPVQMLKFRKVKAKATAARQYIKDNIPNAEYIFVTEDDIFETKADYQKMLKLIDK